MVMKQSMMAKNLRQSILRSLGRYIAIAVIIALGAGMFVGLRSTRNDMVATGQVYTEKQNMFDLRLLSSYGWGRNQVEDIAQLPGVVDAEGVFYTDLILNKGEDEAEGSASVYRFYTLPEKVNRLVLLGGRMPEAPNECLADGFRNGKSAIGTTFTVADGNGESALEQLTVRTFTVVGIVSTPLYMDMNRGNTSVGSGSIANYFFVPEEAFDVEYYTEIHVTIPGEYKLYSDEYNNALSDAADALKPLLEPFARERLEEVHADAVQAYEDGLQEYNVGLEEYREQRKDAEQELSDAHRELLDGEDQLRRSEQQLKDGEQALRDGKEAIAKNKAALAQARKQLANGKVTAYREITQGIEKLAASIRENTEKRQKLDQELFRVNLDLVEVNTFILQFEMGISSPSEEERQAAYEKRETLEGRQTELRESIQQLNGSLGGMDVNLREMTAQLVALEDQFLSAQAQIESGEAQIAAYEAQISVQEQAIADGWKELEKGKQDWNRGWREYLDGRREAKEKFDEADAELADAWEKLEDGKAAIAKMTENPVYILDRNSNMGYLSLDSSSQIVAGVSRVFPVFFLLVAALVCITTMTRMVDEERTQIGTLKALGYSSTAIIGKYLVYAGSSAVLGCVLGVTAGSIVFPTVLWEAYKIMIFITPSITLKFDWLLALLVFVMYTAAMLAVTWYCCYRTLQEVPAELIRPKAPEAGKTLLIERLPFWHGMSFLNKVATRNIFRYRQRLAMMLLGIGGCTALLMTGFGIRDSISKIVDIQFREVMHYDMEVYFREDRTPELQADFRDTMKPYASQILFYNQMSVELDAGTQTRDIYLLTADAEIGEFLDFHTGKTHLDTPGVNEVLISSGIADIMGLHTGDHIRMRNTDMEVLELTISGIYNNHVYNYAVISPETVEQQWGRTLAKQMAFVKVNPGQDAYAAGAAANDAEGVMNVTVSEQTASMVERMMKALDLVVWVVVFCAALLAVIVLYNLTNININERIREIATIKVLGFNAFETAMYVFKENLVLSIMGTVFGIPLGKLLLDFVISQIRIDMIWLTPRLDWPSLVISVVLTVLSAFVVDMIFYYKLEQINMAEALKSVE